MNLYVFKVIKEFYCCFKNFGRGICSNFILMIKLYFGELKKLMLWIDNKGSFLDWMVLKIVIVDLKMDEKYVLI